MILSKSLRAFPAPSGAISPVAPVHVRYRPATVSTGAGQPVDEDSAQGVATAYRAANILCSDFAKMPLQQFRQVGDRRERVPADAMVRNHAYLMEITPNRWGWTPYLLKYVAMQWLLWYGNSYIWSPPVWPFEKFVLPADVTYPVFDTDGDLWYATMNARGEPKYIPGVEVLHTLINPDSTGHVGRGVVEFARESLGRQLGAYNTQSQLYSEGLNPAGYIQVKGKLDANGRNEYREAFGEVMKGDFDGVRLAVFDDRIVKYEPVTMKMVDAQFLEQIQATDRDIANFFGMPLHMLNMGKEAYNSNEQKFNEYLEGTLDAYLVPFEQAARICWLPIAEQGTSYFKFNRSSLLRMDSKARAEMNEILIRSGQRNPNETRSKDDYSAYPAGDKFYMTKNYADVQALGGDDGQK
jgi:HK97 family phage portal protein